MPGEVGGGLAFGLELPAKADVRDADGNPDGDDGEADDGGEDDEDRIGGEDRGEESEPTAEHGEHDGVDRKAALRALRGPGGQHAVVCEGPDHAARGVEVRVRGRDDGREDHEVEEVGGVRNADALEDRHERALEDRGLLHRKKRGEDHDRANEEEHEAHDGRAHGHRNDLLGILRFTCSDTDEFGARESEVDGDHRREQRQQALREEATFGEVAEVRRGRAVGERNDAEDGEAARDDEDLDRDHLDEREDEFALGEELRREDVHRQNQEAVEETPYPDVDVREPVLHRETRARERRADAHRAGHPVEPRDREARARPNEGRGVEVEAARLRHRDAQFAHREHDEVDDERADQIGDDGAEGARLADHEARVEEKARPDHAAQGQHDQVTGLHGSFKLGVLVLAYERRLGCQVGFGHVWECLGKMWVAKRRGRRKATVRAGMSGVAPGAVSTDRP